MQIKVDNTIGFIVGDILVDVDIKFRELHPARDTLTQIAIDTINMELGHLAYKIKENVKDIIENKFRECE